SPDRLIVSVESFMTAFLNMFSNYSPKYATHPVKVKESLLVNLICQISKITLTHAGECLHTADRRITREMFKKATDHVSATHTQNKDNRQSMSTVTDNDITTPVSDMAWDAIQGAYDLQVHVAPDVIERRTDDIDLANDFLARGLRGFVLKSHYIPTAERAQV